MPRTLGGAPDTYKSSCTSRTVGWRVVRIATWNVNSLRSRIDRVEALLDRHEIDVLALQETKAREDQLPLMGLQARGYEVAVGRASTSGTASRSSAGSGSRTSRPASRGSPGWGEPGGAGVAGDRRDLRRRTDLVALRPQRPQARRPALRLQAGLVRRAARGRPATGSTATPCWSATGTSAPPTTTSSTSRQFKNSTHVTPAERAAFFALVEDGWVDTVKPYDAGRTPTGTTTGSASSATAGCGSTSCSARRRWPRG